MVRKRHADSQFDSELRALVKRHAPDGLEGGTKGDSLLVVFGASVLTAVVVMSLVSFVSPSAAMIWGGLSMPVGGGIAALARRRIVGPARLDRAALYGALADAFRAQVEARRAQLLGPESEVGRARAALSDAVQEASRSRAYWSARLGDEVSRELAREQLRTSDALLGKFQSALDVLDRRQAVLRDFLNECEARVMALQQSGRDWQEVERLERLATRADSVVSQAQKAIERIAAGFVGEVKLLAEALGATEAEQLRQVAAQVPMERIEEVAESILAHSEEEAAVLDHLVARLADGS